MDIIPAIDLLGGKCVRLVQGRYDRVIEYQRDPVDVAADFVRGGARWLHVVDLDGARDGEIRNLPALERISRLGASIQFGGGVRDESAIRAALTAGASRVIIGTRALEDWNWFRSMAHLAGFEGRLALGLDARLGKLAVRAWTHDTQRTAADVAESVAGWPLACIVYTDIGRDGMLLGPNIDAIRSLATISSVPVVASGGVTEVEDVRRLARLKLRGIVIGRAIYERSIELQDALAVAGSPDAGSAHGN